MDWNLTEEQRALKQEFEDFFREEMKNAPPGVEHGGLEGMLANDENWQFHRYMGKKLGAKGWLARPWPKEYGGQDASIVDQLIFTEVRAKYRAPGIDAWGVEMFGPTVLIGGDEEQKKRLLPPIAKSEVHYCQGWSEPNAGSDLAALRTTAIKEGDHYVVNGQKIWTTGAHYADHIFLLLRTDPSSKRNAGLAVFSMKLDQPGVDIRPIHYMNGKHVYNEIFFTDVKIPERDRIGPEGEGWGLTRATMNFERSGIGYFVGSKSVLREFVKYIKSAKRDGKPLTENPLVRQRLARLYRDIELGVSLSYSSAWLQHKGSTMKAASSASEAKVFGTELQQRMGIFATEAMGPYGQLDHSKWAPMAGTMIDQYQMAIGGNIAAGSSEIQRNLIAWVGLELPRFK
jgi:alkylation response protein AidB-like acyl-CoA dehydrogenase